MDFKEQALFRIYPNVNAPLWDLCHFVQHDLGRAKTKNTGRRTFEARFSVKLPRLLRADLAQKHL